MPLITEALNGNLRIERETEDERLETLIGVSAELVGITGSKSITSGERDLLEEKIANLTNKVLQMSIFLRGRRLNFLDGLLNNQQVSEISVLRRYSAVYNYRLAELFLSKYSH